MVMANSFRKGGIMREKIFNVLFAIAVAALTPTEGPFENAVIFWLIICFVEIVEIKEE